MTRKLPVYLLLDTSESMAGEALESVEIGVHKTISSLKKNPYALESVHLSIITFAAKAKVVLPFTEILAVNPPALSIKPGTSLGAALDLLRESILKDVTRTTREEKGDFRPLVFILTDGQPTDDWRGPLARLKEVKPRLGHIYGVGCGDEVDFETLGQIADVSIQVEAATSDSLAKFFVWLTDSVQSASVSPDTPLSLEKTPPLDKGMNLIDKNSPPKFHPETVRLHFHATCSKTKKHYLMRYRHDLTRPVYFFERSFAVPEDFFADGSLKAPATDAGSLLGSSDCPYCHGDAWGKCGFCGHIFCLDSNNLQPEVTCPFCETHLTLDPRNDANFSVDGSVG
ncbi:MAG: VWA domain-containing protein [Deltaproteobacteria bacterium]|jgi:uncharacterized protein YegL|nr:VWA domain-containing protein [Deltaproteobacteria bacterium]